MNGSNDQQNGISSHHQPERTTAVDGERSADKLRLNETPLDFKVLVVDDDLAQAEMVREFLRISGFTHIDHAENIHSLWQYLENRPKEGKRTDGKSNASSLDESNKIAHYDIVLLDYKLPDGTGLDVLDQMKERDYQIPVVMVTGQGTERVAAQAIQRGAADYLIKSGDYLFTLPALIRKTVHAHQLQLSIQRSLEQIRYQAMLLNNVRDAIVVWDLSGRITYWNTAATVLFGWSAEERLGRPVAQFYLSTFTPAIVLPKEGSQTDIRPVDQHVVRQCTNRHGKVIWVSSRVVALTEASFAQGDETEDGTYSGAEGSPALIGYMDIAHDISRRVETEQALRESEARYRAIVEDYQTELICRFKPNGTLTFVNEVFCRYFERSRDDLLGMNFLYFIPETERPRLIQHLVSFSPSKPVATLEHRVELQREEDEREERGKTDEKGNKAEVGAASERWLQRTDRAIFDKQGQVFEFQSVGRDITEHRKLEAQVRAAQAHLIHAARLATIGEVASGVAHQIYNPLTTIIADAQLLLRNLPSDHAAIDSARAIEQAGWRMQKAVQRLMEFSRPETEDFSKLSVNETLQSAISLVSAPIEASGCRLEVELDENLPAMQGNPRQLENLWVNLLLLARDACIDGHGELILLQSRAGPAGTILVEVGDDGKPIPSEQLARVFEPSFVDPNSGRGTGMELSICREIVRQHGGQITADIESIHKIDSEVQRDEFRGTIFRVALPTSKSDENSKINADEIRRKKSAGRNPHNAQGAI